MTISKVEKSPHSNQGISLYRQMPTNYLAKKISSISSAIIETLSCLFGYYLWNRIFFAFTGKPWIVKTTDPQNLPKIDTRGENYTESSHLETIRQAKYKIHSTVYNKHKLAETFKGMTQKDENKEEDGNIDKEQQDQKSLWNAQLEKEAVLLAVNKDISRTYSIQTPNETISESVRLTV